MKIQIHRVVDRQRRELLREATVLFMKELVPPHVLQKLHIEIFIAPHLSDYGVCAAFKPHGKAYPTHFHISMHPRGWNQYLLLKTLGHECVHVKQYALGQLKEPSKTETIWYKRKFIDKEIPYHKHPWEIEAAQAEENFWQLWKDRRHLA